MIRAAVVTPWTTILTGNIPQLATEYPLQSWVDITGQPAAQIPPAINELTILAVVDDNTLAAIELDVDYEILWSEEIA